MYVCLHVRLMSECPNWYADGTFKCTPPLFNQLYTIHAVKYSSVIPTVFILMNDRSTNSYVRVFMVGWAAARAALPPPKICGRRRRLLLMGAPPPPPIICRRAADTIVV